MSSSHSTQKILAHARMAESGRIVADPINESISLILDVIKCVSIPSSSALDADTDALLCCSIFIRMVTIMANGQRRK